jgi:hypothetical protein
MSLTSCSYFNFNILVTSVNYSRVCFGIRSIIFNNLNSCCFPFLSSTLCNETARPALSIFPTNNTPKLPIVNRFLHTAYYISGIYFKTLSLSTYDTLKQNVSLSFITCYNTEAEVT